MVTHSPDLSDEKAYWLAFNRVWGLGAVRIQFLLRCFGSLRQAWEAKDTDILLCGLPKSIAEALISARHTINPARELEALAKAGASAVTLQENTYPESLRHISSPPAALYLRGSMEPTDAIAIAVVGTRRATRYGLEATRNIVSGLAGAGITIISGLALGIDAAAHEAALDAGGRTLAVLGCGVDIVYPARHRRLAQRIVESGALVSEYPLGTKPDGRNFPPRNRIISGLAHGVLVVEAGDRSGALITAQFALDQGRDTYAVPGSIYWPQSRGTNRIIQEGAAKLVTDAADILEDMNLSLVAKQAQVRNTIPTSDLENQILTCVGQEPIHIDEIARATGLPMPVVSSSLAMLELKGLVRSAGSMHYVSTCESRLGYDTTGHC